MCAHFKYSLKGSEARECALERSLWLQCEEWIRHIKHQGHEICWGGGVALIRKIQL